jgi:hypothetical protein
MAVFFVVLALIAVPVTTASILGFRAWYKHMDEVWWNPPTVGRMVFDPNTGKMLIFLNGKDV